MVQYVESTPSSRGRTTGRGPNAGQGVDSQEKERFELAEMVADGGFFEEQFGLTLLQSAVGGEIRCGQVQTWMWYLLYCTHR